MTWLEALEIGHVVFRNLQIINDQLDVFKDLITDFSLLSLEVLPVTLFTVNFKEISINVLVLHFVIRLFF